MAPCTVQTEMSLATAGIHCSQRLSGAMEDCSIVRGRQLQMLRCQRCCESACSARYFAKIHGFQIQKNIYSR